MKNKKRNWFAIAIAVLTSVFIVFSVVAAAALSYEKARIVCMLGAGTYISIVCIFLGARLFMDLFSDDEQTA